jgi:hypothetical protein
LAFARDDELRAAEALLELDSSKHELSTRDDFGSEEGKRGPQATARPCAGYIRVGAKLGHRSNPPLELGDALGSSPLLRAKRARRAPLAQKRVSHVECSDKADPSGCSAIESVEKPPAAVHSGRSADRNHNLARPFLDGGQDQLAHAAGCREQRIPLSFGEPRKSDRFRRFDDSAPVRKKENPGPNFAPEWIRDGRLHVRATEGSLQSRRGSFPAVSERNRLNDRATAANRTPGHATRERPRSLNGCQGILEAVRTRDELRFTTTR